MTDRVVQAPKECRRGLRKCQRDVEFQSADWLTAYSQNTESRGLVVKLVRLAQQLALDPRSPFLNPSCEYDSAD